MLDKETTAFAVVISIVVAITIATPKVIKWVLEQLSKNQEFTQNLANASIEQSKASNEQSRASNEAIYKMTQALDTMREAHQRQADSTKDAFDRIVDILYSRKAGNHEPRT